MLWRQNYPWSLATSQQHHIAVFSLQSVNQDVWSVFTVCLLQSVLLFVLHPLTTEVQAPPLYSSIHFPKLSLTHSLTHGFPYITVEVRWSDRMWKMNLSHQDQGELPLRGGFPPAPLLTGLMNLSFLPLSLLQKQILRFFFFLSTKRTSARSLVEGGVRRCTVGNVSPLMRDVTFQPRLLSSTWQMWLVVLLLAGQSQIQWWIQKEHQKITFSLMQAWAVKFTNSLKLTSS